MARCIFAQQRMAFCPFHPQFPSNLLLNSSLLPPLSPQSFNNPLINPSHNNPKRHLSISISLSSSIKIVKTPSLDKHVVKQNKIRFVQKLKTLLLSKPKHYIPINILYKCRSYLSLPKPRSLLSMIHRYPSIFQLFTIPSVVQDHLCVGLTPLAALLASQELSLKSSISINLAIKLQKLLMISPHRRLLLSKLVHLAPDFGLPSNFRSRLCNEYPDRFKTVDTSYGRALELVSWDPNLAVPLPPIDVVRSPDLIVDRPLKFKHLRLRKGLNLKRRHRDFLIKYGELPEVSPYCIEEFEFSEKRACAVVRELLWMTLEKRTLVDHLTHFRKDFGLSNKLRGMIVRHPELFYVSMKGQRDSVFLVEGYDDKGGLLEKDELLSAKERLLELVREGKRMRRERRLSENLDGIDVNENAGDTDFLDDVDDDDDDDGFEDLFEEEDEWEDYGVEDDETDGDILMGGETGMEFWTEASSVNVIDEGSLKPW